MILQFSIGFCLLLLFCECRPADVLENDGLGEIGVNVANKGEKLEAEIERIGKDMQPENVIAHETNIELKINDEFDLKSNLENLTIEKMSSSTTEGPLKVVEPEEQDQEDHEEPGNDQSANEQSEMKIMKINDEFDLKKNFEGFAREATTTTTTTTTTVEPRIEHNESEKMEGDGVPEVPDELHSKEKFEEMAMVTTENPMIVAYGPAMDRKVVADFSEPDYSLLKPKSESNEKPLEHLDSPALSTSTTTENPTIESDDFEHDVKESEDTETLRHPNEKMFGKFSETLRNRILQDGKEILEDPKSLITSPQEPEIYFKPASVRDDDVPDSILVTPEPQKPDEERSKDTIRNRIEIIEVKEEDDDWISWDLIHMLLLLSPYEDGEITWWTIVMEAVKCTLRNCPTKNTHLHHRNVDLPRITRHRRQDSEFDPEAVPIATTPKPCMCKDLEGYFEKMYEEIKAKSENATSTVS